MNRDRASYLATIMLAFADGAKVQRSNDGVTWKDDYDPCFNDAAFEWRVKPEPRIAWVAKAFVSFGMEPPDHEKHKFIKFQEVIE